MPIPSNSITPRTIRAIMPPCRLGANLRPAILAVPKARLPERVNAPQHPHKTPHPRFPESTL